MATPPAVSLSPIIEAVSEVTARLRDFNPRDERQRLEKARLVAMLEALENLVQAMCLRDDDGPGHQPPFITPLP